ncbi:stage III sporulation protein AF [Cytobacillus oceanisediminis]|uniref:Stage III sporulation protein AF n=1 Tax=Niallia alba TaxID=2729105 RepID=A0A7Y0K9P0_9BACI|nr:MULTISPECIES: stage III sporulation protein AF [Bacillaceae]MBQ6447416.1 stage III sporulation protein AF [Bacillus sp. (in: firmicutes)]MBZ9533492.1 stage III sporulation protein AF [Cytobacillus oceanisediminis]NMO78402.1 stage III sporulation protein AF [Niallia alba]UTI41675.1 stage III sporulation protein AF [Niallia sp. RD1]
MNFITEWVTNIILFILLATVVDMLLPNSTFQKYAKMVAGLLLITVILTPVFKLISSDFEDVFTASAMGQPEQKNMNNSIELKKREIQASLDEYTLNKMAVQLKEDANEELIANYGMEINSIQLSIDKEKDVGFPANLTELVIHMKDSKDQNNVVEAVSPVRIDTQQPLLDKDESKQMDTESIISFLSEKWEVRDDAIVIMYEGGEDEKNG